MEIRKKRDREREGEGETESKREKMNFSKHSSDTILKPWDIQALMANLI